MGVFLYGQFIETVGEKNFVFITSSRSFEDPTALKIKIAVLCDMMP
jgi:hypothetical protein